MIAKLRIPFCMSWFWLGASLLNPWQAGAEVKQIAIDDFSACTWDRFIDVQKEAKLAPSLLLTNEMGVTARVAEQLTAAKWAKVVFDIPSAQVAKAQLLFYVNEDLVLSRTLDEVKNPMRLLVNGNTLFHRSNRDQMLTGGWDRQDLPPEYLRDGQNEIVFGDRGVLYVDPSGAGHPSRSFDGFEYLHGDVPPSRGGHSSRSFDGGQTWQSDALGPQADLRGEYMVRLRLQGHPPEGYLTSPVIDLADPEGRGLIAPRMEIRQVHLSARQQTPLGTRIEFEMRTGQAPVLESGRWTAWTTGTALSEPGRYVQWRARLSTQSAAQTPVLEGVVLEAEVEADQLSGLQLLELDQPKIVYSSYAFTYLAPHPRVDQFLAQYGFASTLAGGGGELEQFARLRDWVHSQWLGWQYKYPYCPSWDPLEILHVTKNNLGFGMCTHYAAVFVGAAASLGYVAREVIVDHHCLVEIWSEERQKWILEDPGPAEYYDAYYTLDGEPINGLELHQALAQGRIGEVEQHQLPQGDTVRISKNIADCFVRFGMPLRNNHLVQAEPAELEQGYQHYHWDGYLWWTDGLDPKYPEYSLQSSNPSDFYWGVNQTRLYLQAGEQSGALEVEVETATPNFSHFLVQVDGGAWQEEKAPLRRWQLHEGENALAVRSVNSFGRQGRIARARVQQSAATGVLEDGDRSLPRVFALEQNLPNPFNSNTVIPFALPEEGPVELAVYDLLGRRVATLTQGKQPAGRHMGQWDGRDEAGRSLASGVYLYRLRAGAQLETRKLLLLK